MTALTMLSYDPTISRVRVSTTAIRTAVGADATATIQRSPDQIRWTTIRGGDAVSCTTTSVPADDYEFLPDTLNYYQALTPAVWTDSITPALNGQAWIKNIRFPYLNLPVTLADASDVTRAARSGLFDVVGRTRPVLVSSLRGPAQVEVMIRTETASDREYLIGCLATGDAVLLQAPPTTDAGAGLAVASGYYAVGDYTESRDGVNWERRTFTLPLTEVDAPGPDVVGTTITWTGVTNAYASWNALVAAKTSWNDVVQTLGVAGDAVVP